MTKICARCKIEKEQKEYRKCKSKKDGLFHTCKSCMNEYYTKDKTRVAQRSMVKRKLWADYMFSIKKDLQCKMCPESHPATLDFHHRDPTGKDFTVTDIRYRSFTPLNIELVEKEISKCDVLCANCHRKIHFEE